ncbi:ADP-ribosylglycohydrolase family protein [Pseudonocardia aurantiaca]|uniref:ADP-ribosylglycohydrolase family protein n=1 Tax=Pseudonocardia aurantiaca TaxID=75290 RepID=UPI0031DD018C
MSTERDRAHGALAGLALGDALGMPTQSMSREQIAARYGPVATLLDAAPDQPIAPGMPAGSITDDTEQALLLARLLVEGDGRVDAMAFAEALERWEADMVRRGSADLLGPSTKRALLRLRAGELPDESGRDGTTNGAAMRVTPVGIAFPVADTGRLLDAVVQASRVTHGTTIGIAAAAAVAAAVSAGVAGADLSDALDAAEHAAAAGARRGRWSAGGDVSARLRWARGWVRGMPDADLGDALADVVGTSVAAQESVVAALALAEARGSDPLAALTMAAGIGGDTDTVAAMCGAVLGARHGIAGLPADLLDTLRRVNRLDLEPLVDELLTLRHRTAP